MPTTTPKLPPLSRLRAAYRRARFVANYVQGTMGLENQGLDRAGYRQLVHRTFREEVLKATV